MIILYYVKLNNLLKIGIIYYSIIEKSKSCENFSQDQIYIGLIF